MAKKLFAVVLGFAFAPAFIAADHDTGLMGAFGNQLVGEPCAVRVYHVNFRFPPEGGKIVQYGNELFFIRDYMAGCENAGSNAKLLVSSPNGRNPLNIDERQPYVNPMFTSVPGSQSGHQAPPAHTQQPAGSTTPNCY